MPVTPSITPFSALLAAGALQGFFFSFLLISIYLKKNAANSYLACLVLVFSVELVDEFFIQSRYYIYFPKLSALSWAMDFLYGPLIYLYTRTVTARIPSIIFKTDALHFIPAISAAIGVVLLWTLFGSESFIDLALATAKVNFLVVVDVLQTFLSLISMLAYIKASLRILAAHNKRMQDHFSYSERVSLRWLRNLLLSLLGLYISYVILLFSPDLIWQGINVSNQAFYLAIVICLFSWEYFGLRQLEIFSGVNDTPATGGIAIEKTYATVQSVDVVEAEPEKYLKSPLSAQQSISIQREIRLLMEREKLYLEAKLTLPELAGYVGLSANYVSQAINSDGANFFDFVNAYRIEEAKQRLKNADQTCNVLEIALASGFNSKTAFYSAFKKHTGTTPTEYRKTLSPLPTLSELQR